MDLIVVELKVHPAREHAYRVEHGTVGPLYSDILLTPCNLLISHQSFPCRPEPWTFYILHQPLEKLPGDVTIRKDNDTFR